MTAKNKTIKFVSTLLIISILLPTVLFSFPKKGDAIWGVADISFDAPVLAQGTTTASATTASATSNASVLSIKIKEFAIEMGKQLLKVAAKRLLAQMTQATINWINSGFHGSPLFLENPGSFFKDIAKSEIRNLVDMIGYDTFRFPFGKEVALQVIDSYKSQLATNAQYTLSKVINDPDLLVRYRNDFNIGGWNGFLINTQYPQNNYLGFNMIIKQNLASRLEGAIMTPAQMVKDKLQQGMGFLSPQICPSNPKYNNGANEFLRPTFKPSVAYVPRDAETYDGTVPYEEYTAKENRAQEAYDNNYQDIINDEEDAWADANTCPGGLVSTTPGSVAANQVFSALNTPFLTTALDGALGNSLAAIFDALINKFIDDGLTGLASTINGEPRKDNWSYDGNTLGGLPTVTDGAPPLNIPQNVSVVVGEVTRTRISGGTAPYSIKTQPILGVATATISVSGSSGPTLTVTGITPGRTSVVVQDSSTSSPDVTVAITVNAVGALVVTPAGNISTLINKPIITTISGGTEPYFVQIDPNEAIAITVISGVNLIVTGVAKGSTFAKIEDSSTPKNTVIVPIIINGPNDLVVPDISVRVDQITSIPIGGTGPFTITNQQDIAVATAEILIAAPNVLTVTGHAPGTTVVTIKDSSNKSTSITITTLAPLGKCHISLGKIDGDEIAVNLPDVPKSQCDASGGKWTPNATP